MADPFVFDSGASMSQDYTAAPNIESDFYAIDETRLAEPPAKKGEYGPIETVFQSAYHTTLELVDLTASSITFGGIEKDSIANAVLAELPERVAAFRKDHYGAVEVAGAVAGTLIPALATTRVMSGVGKLGQLASRVPGASKLMIDTNSAATALREVQKAQAIAAVAKGPGLAAIADDAVVAAKKIANSIGRSNALKSGISTEIAVAAATNQSNFLYPTEMETETMLGFAALGALVPVGLDSVYRGYRYRQGANLASKGAHEALDPKGLGLAQPSELSLTPAEREIARLRASDLRDNVATTYATAAQAMRQGNVAEVMGNSAKIQANAFETTANEALHGIWDNGSHVWQGSAGEMTQDVATHMAFTLKRDPTGFLGARKFAPAPKSADELAALLESRTVKVGALRTSADKLEESIKVAQARKLDKLTWDKESISLDVANEKLGVMRSQATEMDSWQLTVMRDGEAMPVESLKNNFTRYSEDDVLAPVKIHDIGDNKKLYGIDKGLDKGLNKTFSLGVYDDLTVSLPKAGDKVDFATDFSALSPYQIGGLYASARKATQSLIKSQKSKVVITPKSNFLEIDMAEEVMRQEGLGTIQSEIRYEGLSRDEALMKSLGQKSELFNRMVSKEGVNLIRIRETLNLPRMTTYERAIGNDHASLEVFFLTNGKLGNPKLDGITITQLKRDLAVQKRSLDLVDVTEDQIDLLGTSMHMGKTGIDEAAENLGEFAVWSRNSFQRDFTSEVLKFEQAARRSYVYELMSDPNQSKFISGMFTELAQSPDFLKAMEISGIQEAGRTSSLPFMQNQINRGTATYFQTTFRDIEPMMAAYRIRTAAEKFERTFTDHLWKQPVRQGSEVTISDSFARLRATSNRVSQQRFNDWERARREGWALKAGRKPAGVDAQGKPLYAFALDTSDSVGGRFNAQKYQTLYGRTMPKDALMPSRSVGTDIQPALVDDLALEALEGMVKFQDAIFHENNMLRQLRGKGTIAYKEWHVPGQRFEGKHIAYIMAHVGGGADQAVYTLRANSASELARMKSHPKVQAFLDEKGASILDHSVAKQYANDLDLDWVDMMDPNIPGLHKEVKATSGGAASLFTQQSGLALDEIKDALTFQVNTLTRNTMAEMFEPQLRYVKSLAKAEEVGGVVSKGKEVPTHSSVFSEYRKVILGERPGDPNTAVRKSLDSIEEVADKSLKALYEKTRGTTVVQGIRNAVFGSERENAKAFKSLEAMGAHNPFTSTLEMVNEQFNLKTPLTLKGITNDVNRITAGITLRWGEIGHPLLNISGVINTMPAVMHHMRMLPGETAAQHSIRVGGDSIIIPTKSGPVAVFDHMKLISRSLNDLFTKAGYDDIARIKAKGLADQSVAEIHKTLGDPSKTQDMIHDLARQADTWLGALSDKSEEFSRLWAHMAGLRLARKYAGGKITDDAADIIAHNFANKVVGDYRTLGRPQMFQGAAGQSLGLFQTYMFNYFSRMFRYLETKDMQSFGTQIGMQAALYGGASVPGYNALMSLYTQLQGQGNQLDPINSMYNRVGKIAGDLLIHGSLAQVPKLAGTYDGISLFTRGDVNPRIVTGINELPGPSVMLNALAGIGKGIDMFREGSSGVSTQQIAEIVANHVGSRPLRGAIEMMLGSSVDKNGRLISDNIGNPSDLLALNTERGMKALARMMSLKTEMEAGQNQAYFNNRAAQRMHGDAMERLRSSTRAFIRSGNMGGVAKSIETYVAMGGQPVHIKTWLKNAYEDATQARTITQFEESLRTGKVAEAMRLWNYGVGQE